MAQGSLFKNMLGKKTLYEEMIKHNTIEVKEASTKSKPSILKETTEKREKMSTFPWLNHGSLIQSRSVFGLWLGVWSCGLRSERSLACAGAEGSARDIAPTLPSLGGKNGIERLVLLPTSVSDLSWCFGSMYKNPYKCYVKRLDTLYIKYILYTYV